MLDINKRTGPNKHTGWKNLLISINIKMGKCKLVVKEQGKLGNWVEKYYQILEKDKSYLG